MWEAIATKVTVWAVATILAMLTAVLPALLRRWFQQLNAKQGKRIEGISEEALARLMRYRFPGNVRELQNILEHAIVLCRSKRIEVGNLPVELVDDGFAGAVSKQDLAGAPLLDAEAGAILETLRRHDGHRGRTAMALGIDKSTLWRKMKKYGITYP